jgi:hypothetical protein
MARKEMEKLIQLIEVYKKLRSKKPDGPVDKACLPIQRNFIKSQIRQTLDYLRKWKVNVKIENGSYSLHHRKSI